MLQNNKMIGKLEYQHWKTFIYIFKITFIQVNTPKTILKTNQYLDFA